MFINLKKLFFLTMAARKRHNVIIIIWDRTFFFVFSLFLLCRLTTILVTVVSSYSIMIMAVFVMYFDYWINSFVHNFSLLKASLLGGTFANLTSAYLVNYPEYPELNEGLNILLLLVYNFRYAFGSKLFS